jgi:hypothetical protein
VTPRALAALVRAGAALLGAMWLVAAVSKALAPEDAYEFAVRVTSPGAVAKAGLALVVGVEGALGAAMLLGAVRGLVPTALLLAAATGALLLVRAQSGGRVPCGCFVVGASVDEALVRNWVLLGATALLLIAAAAQRRARGAEAASGPATPAP